MQPTNRADFLAQQTRELDVWRKKILELEEELAARPRVPEPLRDHLLEVGDRRDRVVAMLGEVSQLSVDDWKLQRETLEAAWEDLRAAWNRIVVLVGKAEERV